MERRHRGNHRRARLAGVDESVYLCDTFKGVVKAGVRDRSYRGGEHDDTTKETVLELMDRLGVDAVRVLEGVFPEDCLDLVKDRTFRFCHIDVDVYQSAKEIADWLWPRLVPGGLVVYDDYGFRRCVRVTRFVNEERAKPDRVVIHNLNGHAIVVKTA